MAQAMACSTMQMLCVVEPRHAAVLLRAGAAPLLVAFVRNSGADECVRGNAAGVLASLAQLRDCQVGCKSQGLCRSSRGLLGQQLHVRQCCCWWRLWGKPGNSVCLGECCWLGSAAEIVGCAAKLRAANLFMHGLFGRLLAPAGDI